MRAAWSRMTAGVVYFRLICAVMGSIGRVMSNPPCWKAASLTSTRMWLILAGSMGAAACRASTASMAACRPPMAAVRLDAVAQGVPASPEFRRDLGGVRVVALAEHRQEPAVAPFEDPLDPDVTRSRQGRGV